MLLRKNRTVLRIIRQFSQASAIPQVPGLPYLGVFNSIDENNLHLQLSELAQDYPKIAQLNIGPTKYNVITDANVARTILKRDVKKSPFAKERKFCRIVQNFW